MVTPHKIKYKTKSSANMRQSPHANIKLNVPRYSGIYYMVMIRANLTRIVKVSLQVPIQTANTINFVERHVQTSKGIS